MSNRNWISLVWVMPMLLPAMLLLPSVATAAPAPPQFLEESVRENPGARYRIRSLPTGVDRVEVFADPSCSVMLGSFPVEKLRSQGWQLPIERVGAWRMRVHWRAVSTTDQHSACAESGLVLDGPEGVSLSLLFKGREAGGGLFEVVRQEQLPVRIYRRLMGKPQDKEWGRPIQLIGIKDPDRFVDPGLRDGVAYEYKVEQEIQGVVQSKVLALGSVLPAVESRGGVLLVVESEIFKEIQGELTQFKADLKDEGWNPEVIQVSGQDRSDRAAAGLKARIKVAYEESNRKIQALVLVGGVPSHGQGDLWYGLMRKRGESLDLAVGRLDPGGIENIRAYFRLNHAYRSGKSPAGPADVPSELRARRSWRMDPMDLGSTLGYVQRLSALPSRPEDLVMGDPTLRLRPIARPTEGSWSVALGPSAFLKWKASPSAGVGSYWIYHSHLRDSGMKKVGQTQGDQHWYQHVQGFDPARPHYYWIRAVRLEKTPSGTYINTSPFEKVESK